jgi:hypothetical protein
MFSEGVHERPVYGNRSSTDRLLEDDAYCDRMEVGQEYFDDPGLLWEATEDTVQ